MARLLVATDLSSLAQRGIAQRLADKARADGHDAVLVEDAPLAACKDADGVIALVDGSDPAGMPIAAAATANALGIPTLALHTHALPSALASLFTQAVAVTREEDLAAALPPFYAEVRPFAGKLVRDQVPRLVREAGHDVQFREARPEERVRYLKRKVADEAQELVDADEGKEAEEVADLLEALETLLRVRGHGRDHLKAVKDAKRKRRGGFDRFFIVEAATAVSGTPPIELPSPPAEEPRLIWAATPPAPTIAEPEPALPSLEALEQPPTPVASPEPASDEPLFQMPAAFLEPEPVAPAPEPAPEVALPSWMASEAPTQAPPAMAVAPSGSIHYEETRRAPAAEPVRTYEAPPPVFQPPAIPSFRIQSPPPAPHNRTKLWNLGAKGEQQEIPAVYDDPDRIEPSVREI